MLKLKTAMAKIGRNDACPCGSGKKYKRCCLAKDEEAERAARAAVAELGSLDAAAAEMADELTIASNVVVDHVDAGELDAAERAARELLERFPHVHDRYDRLGMVYEARGDNRQAADCYRKVIDIIRAHPDDYDPEFETVFQSFIDRLDSTDAS